MAPELWDCFFFNDELDLLKFRLLELGGIVDRFLIVESPVTFTGLDKPLLARDNLHALREITPQVDCVAVQIDGDAQTAWDRENAQRKALRTAVTEGPADDLLLIGDVDEIPDRDVLPSLKPKLAEPTRLGLHHSTYFANWVLKAQWLDGPIISRRGDLDRPILGDLLDDARPDPNKARRGEPILQWAGRHLANLGGAPELRSKFRAYSHQEFNTARNHQAHLERCVHYGVHFTGRDVVRRLARAELDPLLTRLLSFRAEWFNFDVSPTWLRTRAYCGYTWLRQGRLPGAVVKLLDEHDWLVTTAGAPLFVAADTGRRAARRPSLRIQSAVRRLLHDDDRVRP